jgi:hypothetical protein
MSNVISCKVRKQIYAARGRTNKTWRHKRLPSRMLIRVIVSNSIIAEILKEERLSHAQIKND